MGFYLTIGLVLLLLGAVVALAVVIDPVKLARALPTPVQWMFNRILSQAQGAARWMSASERKEFIKAAYKGFVLGPGQRMSLDQSNRNFVVVGPTGGGKTTKFVLPNMFERRGSFVVFDLGGHIFAKTSGEMERRSYNIEVLAPAAAHQQSKQYNPLHRRRQGRDLRKLARALCQRVTSSNDAFWGVSAITPLYCVLKALKGMTETGHDHLGNARHLVNGLAANSDAVKQLMAASLDAVTWSEFEGFMGLDDRTRAQHLGTVLAALEAWSDPDIARVTAGDNIDLAGLRQRETVIYVVVPEAEVDDYAVLMNLFLADVFRQCYRDGETGLPVQILADEFGNIGKVEGFKSAITTLRKYGVSTTIFLQSLSQLKATYGDETAETIFEGGVANKVFLSGLWRRQCEEISQILGSETIYDTTYGGMSDSGRTLEKPLLRPDEVRMLEDDEAIIVASNKRPLKMRLTPFYADARMSAMARQHPAKIDYSEGRTDLTYLDLGQYRQLSEIEYLVNETTEQIGPIPAIVRS